MAIIINSNIQNFFSNTVGKKINSPEQRLLQGFTALMLQPYLDYKNKKTDDDTRAISVARTTAKIIAGTAVGVLVRYGAIFAIKKFSKYQILEKTTEGFIKRVAPHRKADIFMPNIKYSKPRVTEEDFAIKYDNFIKGIGTLLATFAMAFTNFAFDAPCTKYLTEKFTPIVKKIIDKLEDRHESRKSA